MAKTVRSVSVRLATLADLPRIVEFNQGLAWESESKELDPERLTRGVKRALQSPSLCRYYVAEFDGNVIGQTMVTYEVTDWRDGVVFWIQSVYVHSDWRRQGIYSKLYQHVIEVAKQRGDVRGVRLYVEKDNVVAQKAYEQLGMERANYHMYEVGLT